VDSYSDDRTLDVAAGAGAKVMQHKFEGHIQQKNWAKEQAQHDYVLSLDADEALSDELSLNIRSAKKNFEADGYTMNRLNFYCGRAVKTCGWYPDKKLRLWNRKKGNWTGRNPHDMFVMVPGSNIRHLAGDILHNTYPTHEAFLSQVDKFASIGARELKSSNGAYLFLKMIFSPPFRFFKSYLIKLGITDGVIGLTICYHQAREVSLKYARALKLKYA
jgi:glycosyltransferase involved in cell wall biosynthesis